jgi:uncharacterized protein (DUF1684 family)
MADASRHRDDVEAWRRARYEALRRDVGWLTLAGLHWLRAGVNRIGADAGLEVVLPSGPGVAGTVTVTDGTAVADGAFTYGGRPVRQIPLVNDADGQPTMLELGPLRLCLIERGGRLAIRTWDTALPTRYNFEGIDHWPVDPAWRLPGRLEPTPGGTIRVPDIIGHVDEKASPGEVAFDVGGVTHRLQALEGGPAGELWLVFADETNGVETYGAGRFLYTAAPDVAGRVEVDFNRAYNPPCIFSPYATCPLPWPGNRLPIRVEAGERSSIWWKGSEPL